jgi:PhnB protein
MQIHPIPNVHQPLAPYIVVQGAEAAIAFYTNAFGAELQFALREPSGKVGHAELLVGGGRLMLAEEYPDFGALSPITVGGSPVTLHLYVPDVDAFVAIATAAGATLLRPLRDEFYGDRVAMLSDPFGHKWHVASRKELVSPAEMQTRMNKLYG